MCLVLDAAPYVCVCVCVYLRNKIIIFLISHLMSEAFGMEKIQ